MSDELTARSSAVLIALAAVFMGQGVVAGFAAKSTGELRANRYATGLSQVEPVPVSPLRASIPFAGGE